MIRKIMYVVSAINILGGVLFLANPASDIQLGFGLVLITLGAITIGVWRK